MNVSTTRKISPWLVLLTLVFVVLLQAGCRESPQDAARDGTATPPTAPTAEQPATEPSAEEEAPLVVFLGDSLTAGYGLAEEQAFPALVAAALRAEGRAVRVVNAGVSGDTTAGGLRRVDWLVRQRPDVLVVCLGGNDGLRGLALEDSERNLRETVARARAAGARVLLAGMLIPPNYGPDYTEAFAAMYPRVAEEAGVVLLPFLLEGVGGDPALNQADGIHPTAEGQAIVAETVLPYVVALLDEVAAGDANP